MSLTATRPPSGTRPLPTPIYPKRVRPVTYTIAVYLLGAALLFQFGMVISVFWLRAMVVSVNTQIPRSLAKVPTTAASAPVKPTNDLPSLPGLSTTSIRPALLAVPTATDKLSQIGTLNDQALALVRKSQFQPAINLLTQAEDLDPRNPNTLKNLAETFYLMNDSNQARIFWQRLVDLGPGVGTVYGLARDHVMLLAPTHDDQVKPTALLPRQIYIDAVQKSPVETVNGQAQFSVHAVLMRQDSHMAGFDQKKLQPYVIFYQQMKNGTLLPDLSQRKGAFEDTFLFWNNKLREPFGVDYVMPVPGAPGPNNTTMGEYYGFVIGIYYDKKLQDARGEPADMLTRQPLPLEIE